MQVLLIDTRQGRAGGIRSETRRALLYIVVMQAILQLSMRRVLAFVPPSSRRAASPSTSLAFTRSPSAALDNKNKRIQVACFSSKKPNTGNNKKKKKFKVNPNVSQDNLDRLTAAFDDLAKKEGFDDSTAFYADDETFEDDFDYTGSLVDVNAELNPNDFDESDFALLDNEDDDDFLDFGTDDDNDDNQGSMEARIAAAKRDMDLGRVSVPKELDNVSQQDLRRLGFKPEANPFGKDETPRKQQFQLITNAMSCCACGADFQCSNEHRPGYLPPDKFATQVKLQKIEELQQLQEKAQNYEWSPEDEIEFLIQTSGDDDSSKQENDPDVLADIDIAAVADEMDLDLVELAAKKVICKRCHGLQNFGKVEATLRPGWTEEPMLSQAKFRELLRPIREKPAVIVALVDLFDFSGSVLPELDAIAGDNPVILAANKADLLPSEMGQARAENWVRRELEYLGIQSIANVGGAVRLVSCKTGFGVAGMLAKARRLAEEMDCDMYIVGAANAGKSTLINTILEEKKDKSRKRGKVRAGNANKFKGAVTTSPLPGTTLKFIKIDLGEGKMLYDTPGLLVNGTLTQLLTPEELKMVVPKKKVEPITFRVASGKCVLVGGLAKIEVVGDSKPFLFTFFVANDIKLHPTDSSKANDYVAKHAGTLLTPPLEPGPERLEELGEFESHVVNIEGTGWKEAAADITLRGLGWVAVTGAGTAQVKISVPKGIGVSIRPPLMPFDIWEVAAKYTGGRAVRKSSKTKTGKRRKGVGRR